MNTEMRKQYIMNPDFPDVPDISICNGCMCMTHTYGDGTCAKCGEKKEKEKGEA